jgi:hypothetical protein
MNPTGIRRNAHNGLPMIILMIGHQMPTIILKKITHGITFAPIARRLKRRNPIFVRIFPVLAK